MMQDWMAIGSYVKLKEDRNRNHDLQNSRRDNTIPLVDYLKDKVYKFLSNKKIAFIFVYFQ